MVVYRYIDNSSKQRNNNSNYDKDNQRRRLTTTMTTMAQKTEKKIGCGFFAYSSKLPAYSGAFLLTIDNFSFFAYSWSFFAYNFSFFTYSWSFFAYSGKVHLLRTLRGL